VGPRNTSYTAAGLILYSVEMTTVIMHGGNVDKFKAILHVCGHAFVKDFLILPTCLLKVDPIFLTIFWNCQSVYPVRDVALALPGHNK
jgi:hypothetical protein